MPTPNKSGVTSGICYICRSYGTDRLKDSSPLHYKGGVKGYSLWLERGDIGRFLIALGFRSIKVQMEGESSRALPFVSLFALYLSVSGRLI